MRTICIFIFLLLVSHLVCVQLSGLRQRKTSFYYYMKTWREAQTFCSEKHDDLISVRHKAESQAFYMYKGWLGLYRENDTSPWKWSSRDKIATFFNWDSGERDLNQNCGYKRPSTSKWEDDVCSFQRFYICYEETLVLVNKNKTWDEALEHCRSLKGVQNYDLATLITPDNHDYARERAQQSTTEEVWTGLRYLGDEWFWVGGEPVIYQDIPTCPAVRCGVLEKDSNTSFGIRDCNQRRSFFCYKKPESP